MTQTSKLTAILAFSCLLSPLTSHADECWSVSTPKGYSAFAGQDYKFSPDRLFAPFIVCFGSDGGSVTGTLLELVKVGDSTLIGISHKNSGFQAVEVYQLDREKKKLLFVRSKTHVGSSSVASAFVGDATLVSKR